MAVKTIHQDSADASAAAAHLLPGSQSENAKTFGGYPALFLGGAAVGIIGAVPATRIKGVK